jgi:hypothetical protein
MKQKLATRGERGPNVGLKPTYTYGRHHYRRALQLIRLHGQGYEDVDALRLQLFLRGYAPGSVELAKSVLVEYRHTRTGLNAPVRSTYVDRLGPIPDKRLESLIGQLGPADPLFEEAGVVPPPELLVAFVRGARSPLDLGAGQLELPREFEDAAKMVAGLLSPSDEELSATEELIQSSTEEDFQKARDIFWGLRQRLRGDAKALSGATRQAADFAQAMWFQREPAGMNFVAALKVARQNQEQT